MKRLLAILFVSACSLQAERPELEWAVEAAGDPSEMQEIRAVWTDESTCMVLRKSALLGLYQVSERKTLWEKAFDGNVEGFCVGAASAWVVNDIPGKDRALLKIAPKDGSVEERIPTSATLKRFGVKLSLPSALEWVPGQNVLAIEEVENRRSNLHFVDPEKSKKPVMAELVGYFWNTSSMQRGAAYVHHGVIYRIDARSGTHETVWDTGLGEGGEDYPALCDYAVTPDGGFAAIVDKGGWSSGFDLSCREGKDGEIRKVTSDLEVGLVKIDMPRRRIIRVSRDKPTVRVLDFQMRSVGEPSERIPHNCWHASISPSGNRVALIDAAGAILFFRLPEQG
ncbi:hypothetical protein HAHE_10660 [Haloferula helveola]|uniref:Uncharacterized protein n=1 Tax=Haloferula helveola TaxID=490095 RepID=A0ABM7RE52_9BACT|nr:hypothetical protein HAHE_10660 [Haloferula helveola]